MRMLIHFTFSFDYVVPFLIASIHSHILDGKCGTSDFLWFFSTALYCYENNSIARERYGQSGISHVESERNNNSVANNERGVNEDPGYFNNSVPNNEYIPNNR